MNLKKSNTAWSGIGFDLSLDGLSLDLSLYNYIQVYVRLLNPFKSKLRLFGDKVRVFCNKDIELSETKFITCSIVFTDDLSTSFQSGIVNIDNINILVFNLHLLGLRFGFLSKTITKKNKKNGKTRCK